MQSYINMKEITKTYESSAKKVTALDKVTLTIEQGEFVAIMGPSGSGKSTLSHLIGGMDIPTSGEIQIAGQSLTQKGMDLGKWRAKNVGFVFQQAFLMPGLTAVENVQVPLLLHNLSTAQRRDRAHLILELVGLKDVAQHKPREMSGGQEHRCALARALVSDPEIIICDEPTGALDKDNAIQVLQLLSLLSQKQNKTVIVVTHDHKVSAYANRTIQIESGRIASERCN